MKMLSIIIGILFMSVSSLFAQWKSMSPTTSITGMVKINSTIYFAYFGDGVYRTENQGYSFDEFNTGLTNINIRSICVLLDSIVVVSTDEGVFKRTTNSEKWAFANKGLDGQQVYRFGVFNSEIFAVTTNGIYKTTDLKNWLFIGKPIQDMLLSFCTADSLLFVGTSNGIYQSLDSGTSWQYISATSAMKSVNSIVFNNNTIYSGADDGIYISKDFGKSWIKNNSNDSVSPVKQILVVDSTIYVSTFYSGIFKSNISTIKFLSINYADSYHNLLNPNVLLNDKEYLYSGGNSGNINRKPLMSDTAVLLQGGIVGNSISAISKKSDTLIVGSYNGRVNRSYNNGKTWEDITNNLSAPDISCIYQNSNIILVGTNIDGLYRSDDYGATWEDLGFEAVDFIVDIDSSIIMSNALGGMKISRDKGKHWGDFSVGLNNHYPEYYYKDRGTLYIAELGGKIYKLSSNKTQWEEVMAIQGSLIKSFCVNNQDIFISATPYENSFQGILKYHFDGNNWILADSILSNYYIGNLAYQNHRLFASPLYLGLFISDENSNRISLYEYGLNKPIYIQCLFPDDSIIFAGTNQGLYYLKFTDLIESPKLLSPSNNSININPEVSLNWENMQDSKSFSLQLSTNQECDSLVLDTNDLINNVLDFKLKTNTRYFWRVKYYKDNAVSGWSEIWNFTIGFPSSVNDEPNTHVLIFPQPVSETLEVKLNDTNENIIEIIEIYDAMGNQCGNYNIDNPNNNIRLNLSNLSKGLYNILIKTKNNTLHSNFIKI